jgi:chemotaxis-related protein WspB
MLFVIFHCGESRYALNASHVVEILPLVRWTPVAEGSVDVAGVFNYHGTPIPLVDLSERLAQRPSRNWMSTRIIVIRRGAPSDGEKDLLGLVAERATNTARQNEVDFQNCDGAGANLSIQTQMIIQLIDVEKWWGPAKVVRNNPCHFKA